MKPYPREGVVKEEKFPNNRKTSHLRVCGEFWTLWNKARVGWFERIELKPVYYHM